MRLVQPPHPSSGHYSPAIISECGLVFVSGQSSVDPNTLKVPEGGFGAEMTLSLTRVENILKMASIDRNHIISASVFITDMNQWDAVNAAWAKFFGSHKPARAIYEVSRTHHGGHVEVQVVAEI